MIEARHRKGINRSQQQEERAAIQVQALKGKTEGKYLPLHLKRRKKRKRNPQLLQRNLRVFKRTKVRNKRNKSMEMIPQIQILTQIESLLQKLNKTKIKEKEISHLLRAVRLTREEKERGTQSQKKRSRRRSLVLLQETKSKQVQLNSTLSIN